MNQPSSSLVMLDALMSWFQQVRTPYPFRQGRNPYRVWISEVVLQQTRIQAALVPLARFLDTFPDVKSLANADLDQILLAFRGLGYYSRAKNLHKAAQYLMEHHQGELPTTYQELIQVPSIGPYTAAAISSICFGEKQPVVDGNIKRIVARLFMLKISWTKIQLAQECLQFLAHIFSVMPYPPGDTNEAWMELGQKCCVPKKPVCSSCPITNWCQAFLQNKTADFPIIKEKKEMLEVNWYMYLLVAQHKIMLQRWQNFYFLKGQWCFPSRLEFANGKRLCSWDTALLPEIQPISYSLPALHHSITHHRITIHTQVAQVATRSPVAAMFPTSQASVQNLEYEWLKEQQVSSRLVSSALQRVWSLYQKHQHHHSDERFAFD